MLHYLSSLHLFYFLPFFHLSLWPWLMCPIQISLSDKDLHCQTSWLFHDTLNILLSPLFFFFFCDTWLAPQSAPYSWVLLLLVWSAAWVSPGSFLEAQNLRPCPRLTESESAISQDPQAIHVQMKVWAALASRILLPGMTK